MADEVILINVFEVPAAEAERFIAAWERHPALYRIART